MNKNPYLWVGQPAFSSFSGLLLYYVHTAVAYTRPTIQQPHIKITYRLRKNSNTMDTSLLEEHMIIIPSP
jgi:hypothetical protein